jgi:hypothetical protein
MYSYSKPSLIRISKALDSPKRQKDQLRKQINENIIILGADKINKEITYRAFI